MYHFLINFKTINCVLKEILQFKIKHFKPFSNLSAPIYPSNHFIFHSSSFLIQLCAKRFLLNKSRQTYKPSSQHHNYLNHRHFSKLVYVLKFHCRLFIFFREINFSYWQTQRKRIQYNYVTWRYMTLCNIFTFNQLLLFWIKLTFLKF